MMRPKRPRSLSCRRNAWFSRFCCVDLGEPLEQPLQLVRIERLGEVVLGAGLDRFDGGVDGALRGQQDHLDVVDLGLQRLQQLDAAHPRHHQVGDDDRGAEGGDLLERLGAVGGGLGGESPRPHQLGQPAARRGIVLDDQDAFGGMRRVGHCFQFIIRISTEPT